MGGFIKLSNYKFVISIDPGGTNGYCMASKASDKDWTIIKVDGVEKHELYKILENMFINENPKDILAIYEAYRLYASKSKAMIGNEFETVQIIGVIKYICEKRGIVCVDSPTTNKAFWSDKRLKEMNLYVPIDHKRDAIRHFLHWLYFIIKEADLNDLVKPPQRDG